MIFKISNLAKNTDLDTSLADDYLFIIPLE